MLKFLRSFLSHFNKFSSATKGYLNFNNYKLLNVFGRNNLRNPNEIIEVLFNKSIYSKEFIISGSFAKLCYEKCNKKETSNKEYEKFIDDLKSRRYLLNFSDIDIWVKRSSFKETFLFEDLNKIDYVSLSKSDKTMFRDIMWELDSILSCNFKEHIKSLSKVSYIANTFSLEPMLDNKKHYLWESFSEMNTGDLIIQFIKRPVDSATEIISAFDIDNVKVAIELDNSCSKFVALREFIESNKNKELRLSDRVLDDSYSLDYRMYSLNRAFKYVERYNLSLSDRAKDFIFKTYIELSNYGLDRINLSLKEPCVQYPSVYKNKNLPKDILDFTKRVEIISEKHYGNYENYSKGNPVNDELVKSLYIQTETFFKDFSKLNEFKDKYSVYFIGSNIELFNREALRSLGVKEDEKQRTDIF